MVGTGPSKCRAGRAHLQGAARAPVIHVELGAHTGAAGDEDWRPGTLHTLTTHAPAGVARRGANDPITINSQLAAARCSSNYRTHWSSSSSSRGLLRGTGREHHRAPPRPAPPAASKIKKKRAAWRRVAGHRTGVLSTLHVIAYRPGYSRETCIVPEAITERLHACHTRWLAGAVLRSFRQPLRWRFVAPLPCSPRTLEPDGLPQTTIRRR